MTLDLDKAKGMFLGLAVGDALGTTLEFSRPEVGDKQLTEIIGGGPFHLQPGHFTDDTSMAIAMAESLMECDGFEPVEVMAEFRAWQLEGRHSPDNRRVDIGETTRESLDNWRSDRPYVGPSSYDTSGNGGIMRLAPIVIWNRHSYEDAIVDAVRQSMLTHASEQCVRYAQAMAAVLWHGKIDDIHGEKLGHPKKLDDTGNPYSGGHVVETYSAACWAVRNTDNFRDALIKAVNLRYDADTVGAVTGQIAGSIYGLQAIPASWLETLAWKEKIETMATELWESAPKNMANT